MILLLIGLGIKEYFRFRMNSFDFFVILISSVDIALTYSNSSTI
jgi:hypothetical protein